MAQALNEHGVAHEFVTNPDWGHGFDAQLDDDAVQAAFARVLAFLARHVS
jgi:dipeptidyl aminopeptidase/acylaminoacyl peptidase